MLSKNKISSEDEFQKYHDEVTEGGEAEEGNEENEDDMLRQMDEKIFFDEVFTYLKDFKDFKIKESEFDEIPKLLKMELQKEFSEDKGKE